MVEIYSYNITTHERYDKDQAEIEAFRKQYHVPPSGARYIAAQATVLDLVPKHPAVVLLMQTYQRKMWSSITLPKDYSTQRVSSPYVAPSLGPIEKQDADVQKIHAYIRKLAVDYEKKPSAQYAREKGSIEQEAKSIIDLLEKGVKETNILVDMVIARTHQFIHA